MADWSLTAALPHSISCVLRSYAIICFSQRSWIGLLFLAATMLVPQAGLCGLFGVVVAYLVAKIFSLDSRLLENGTYLFNAILISLFIGYAAQAYQASWLEVLPLVASGAIATLFTTSLFAKLLYERLALPWLSLPAVVLILLLGPLIHGLANPNTWTKTASLPESSNAVTLFLSSLGGILFLPRWEVGLILLGCWLWESRFLALYSLLGYVVGYLGYIVLSASTAVEPSLELGLNWILSGVAIGCIFFIPSLWNIPLVALTTLMTTLITLALRTSLDYLALPPIPWAFNAVVPLVLITTRQRTHPHRMIETPFYKGSPEANMDYYYLTQKRFCDWWQPALTLPFTGPRMITQGFNGKITHQENYRYALDFEAIDETGCNHKGDGIELESFYTFNTPVLAPANGWVVHCIHHYPDHPVGSQDIEQNWGNHITLLLDNGYHATLCHLRQGSAIVRQGDRVAVGQKIALCGNSGRSPIPHLHLQVQNSPTTQTITQPFQLKQYLRDDGEKKRFIYRGTPTDRERIEPALFSKSVASCFNNITAREYRFMLNMNHHNWTETVEIQITAASHYRLYSSKNGAILTAILEDQTFRVLDYQGPGDSVLNWLGLGLSSVPFIEPGSAEWTDSRSASPLLSFWGRRLSELWGLKGSVPLLKIETSSEINYLPNAIELEVNSRIHSPFPSWMHRHQTPKSIGLRLAPGQFVLDGVVQFEQGSVTITQPTTMNTASSNAKPQFNEGTT